MYSYVFFYCMENFKMTSFSEEYLKLKNQIDDDKSKLIVFLIFGLVLGRFYEKTIRLKKIIFKKFK